MRARFGLVRPFLTAFIAGLVLASCSSTTEPHAPPPELQALPRNLTSAEQTLIGASNTFSFALWNRIAAAQPNDNVFISPLGASLVLGMALDGAAGTSFEQIRGALQLGGLAQPDINAGYKSLIALLTSLDSSVTMRVANAIWYRQGFPFNESFLTDARSYFGSNVKALDFDDATGSLQTVNDWVYQATDGRIPTILDNIDPADVMLLVNALYFNGSWRSAFDPAQTMNAAFSTAPGRTQPVRLMQRHEQMLYAETPDYQAVDLPYGNGAFAMTVVLPRPGKDLQLIGASLTEARWHALSSSFAKFDVELALPKFSLSFERALNDALQALGMIAPFEQNGADFTRMSPAGRSIYISLVKQKTFVKVDEVGTEAAAVTSAVMTETSLDANTRVMRVDHPFLFVIRERLSGTILFMGKVMEIPAAS